MALALDAGPGRRGDDLARLGLNVAEADLLVFLRYGEMGVLAAGFNPFSMVPVSRCVRFPRGDLQPDRGSAARFQRCRRSRMRPTWLPFQNS